MSGCGCAVPNNKDTWDAYLQCGAVTPQPITDDMTLLNIAASNGASSTTWFMCYAIACMKARRMIYWRVNPGDCNSNALGLNSSTIVESMVGRGLGSAATLDPEPISKGILTGVATILGGFTAVHAQAVATEETTACAVAVGYNQAAEALEQAIEQGVMTPNQASALLQQIIVQLVAKLSPIVKTGNFGFGMRIALYSMQQFCTDVLYNALVPQTQLAAVPPPASPGAPGTQITPPGYQTQNYGAPPLAAPLYPVPPQFPSAPSTYQGSSGFIPTPLNANNGGVGISSSILPANLTPGTILLIGGVAFVASEIG